MSYIERWFRGQISLTFDNCTGMVFIVLINYIQYHTIRGLYGIDYK